ncbi:hypothetical protein FIBSPDRAFT_951481 [Athelia psychrophila]|uniref:Uncharacterized protein n=1 Tax=Athelia psychrophila TaxID=1759441 RepID=A0A166MP97_9AGAM|nr:hypothetical protein FIBSPDRAFT_951481 [Fibularhizoctonia sp. CBS 109695]
MPLFLSTGVSSSTFAGTTFATSETAGVELRRGSVLRSTTPMAGGQGAGGELVRETRCLVDIAVSGVRSPDVSPATSESLPNLEGFLSISPLRAAPSISVPNEDSIPSADTVVDAFAKEPSAEAPTAVFSASCGTAEIFGVD